VIGVIEKQKFVIEVQVYNILVHNAWVMEVKEIAIDLGNFVEVVVGQAMSTNKMIC